MNGLGPGAEPARGRSGVTHRARAAVGILVVLVSNGLLGALCYRLLASGWRLRQ